jgi:hypothetical protein
VTAAKAAPVSGLRWLRSSLESTYEHCIAEAKNLGYQ